MPAGYTAFNAVGQSAHGDQRTLNAYQCADDAYELRDRARPMRNSITGEILTYDAAQIVWLDGTAADTDLATRHGPARRC